MKNIIGEKNMKAKFLSLFLIVLFIMSCPQPETQLEDHSLSQLYGYTYTGTIQAESGATLTPTLIIYDNSRCDWNMSSTGMENNQFYYLHKKNRKSNYTLYWFNGSKHGEVIAQNTSAADMEVQLGINSLEEITILLTQDDHTGIDGMSNTRVTMKRTSDPRKTSTPTIDFNQDIQESTITLPDGVLDATWPSEWSDNSKSFPGTFNFFVKANENNLIAAQEGTIDAQGTRNTQVTLTKGTEGFITLTTPPLYYSSTMFIKPYEINDIAIKKEDDILYFTKGKATIEEVKKDDGSSITINLEEVIGQYKDGVLKIKIIFKPGAMPFPIYQDFCSD